MNFLIGARKDLLQLKSELLGIRVELKFMRFLHVAFKAGFNHDQPRMSRGPMPC